MNNEIDFRKESIEVIFREGKPLLGKKSSSVDPDSETIMMMERLGSLACYTARVDGHLAGGNENLE